MAVEPKITPKLTPNKQKKQKQRLSTTHIKENDKKMRVRLGEQQQFPSTKSTRAHLWIIINIYCT